MTNEEIAIRAWLSKPYPYMSVCGCAGPMKFVEIVEGRYYQIHEHRSPDGITHTAKEIFKIHLTWEEFQAEKEAKEELENNMTLKDRLQKKWRS